MPTPADGVVRTVRGCRAMEELATAMALRRMNQFEHQNRKMDLTSSSARWRSPLRPTRLLRRRLRWVDGARERMAASGARGSGALVAGGDGARGGRQLVELDLPRATALVSRGWGGGRRDNKGRN
jgi:hypothetical protein